VKRVAIVTGGAGGIGRAVLARLASDGYATVSWDLAPDAPADCAMTVDVTDAAVLDEAAARTAALGPIAALVVNAGILGPVARTEALDPADIRRVIDTNLISAFLCLRAVIPHMLSNPGPVRGRIVLMSSIQAKEGTALSGPYAAAKAGLIALAKVAAKENAAEGILINAVTPTVVRTKMERDITDERRQYLLDRIPMARFAEPEEVAEMVAWLCGPHCTFSTGAVFDLSGGRATS
jgi:NAD(P)-dependent dehydrogenase (short-subunit alcohol dehydrogenase family)